MSHSAAEELGAMPQIGDAIRHQFHKLADRPDPDTFVNIDGVRREVLRLREDEAGG